MKLHPTVWRSEKPFLRVIGIYSEGPAAEMEMGHRHLAVIMKFFGIPSFEGLFVEGHNQFPDRAQSIKEEAITRARELAKRF
jgi:FMN-dependent NADH-azoreductase